MQIRSNWYVLNIIHLLILKVNCFVGVLCLRSTLEKVIQFSCFITADLISLFSVILKYLTACNTLKSTKLKNLRKYFSIYLENRDISYSTFLLPKKKRIK